MANNQSKLAGITGTLLFHALLFLFLFLFVIKTPIPPYPETGSPGLEVNFGFDETGLGDNQSEQVASTEEQVSPVTNIPENIPKPTAVSPKENILTQSTEEAPAVVSNQEAENKPVSESQTRQVNKRALFPGSKQKKDGSPQGDGGPAGNKGDPDGTVTSRVYGPGGNTGTTTGEGNDNGKAPNVSLKGRKTKSLQVPVSNEQEVGSVVVRIWVDKEGNVTRVKSGEKGTTVWNTVQLDLAAKAARQAKFNADPNADPEQSGTITFHFENR